MMSGSGITHHVTHTFNATHRTQVTQSTVSKLTKKFKRTDYIAKASRSVRTKTATDDVTLAHVLGFQAIRLLPAQMGIRQSSVGRVVRFTGKQVASIQATDVVTSYTSYISHHFHNLHGYL